MRSVRIDAPAKVNLRLVVLARETGGYHSIETLFCGVSLVDHIEITASTGGLRLEVIGDVDTGPPERNLVLRAARLFFEHLRVEPEVAIQLEKNIPAAAGLGGGSSDAAATLRALNLLHGEPFDRQTLLGWGAALGSDIPFFLAASPYALAWSRGDRLLELNPPPSRPVLIANPGIDMSTAEVFARLAELREMETPPPPPFAHHSSSLSDWSVLEQLARNDLESAVAAHIPNFADAIQCLARSGASIRLLSGSGASIFGVFESLDDLSRAEVRLRELGFATRTASTLVRWPDPRAS